MNEPTNNHDNNPEGAQRGCGDPVDSLRFQCPACRARQPLQNDCRRCGADLSLVVAARYRAAFLKEQLRLASEGSTVHKQFTKELQMIVGKVSTA